MTSATDTVNPGATATYTATASDDYGDTWDVTGATSFSIDSGAGGSWGAGSSSNVFTSENSGTWTVTGTYGLLSDTASLTVNATPQGEPSQDSQAVVYGDAIATVTIDATDADGAASGLAIGKFSYTFDSGASTSGLPSWLSLSAKTTVTEGPPSEATWAVSGTARTPIGTYVISYAVTDGAGASYSDDFTITVGTRDLNVSATGIEKSYDGTTAATVTLSSDKLSGDTLTLDYSGASLPRQMWGPGRWP